jgi:hypothetical protein
MAKIDDVMQTEKGPGFVVRGDNNRPIAVFAFDNSTDAEAARQKMIEILETCRHVQALS